MIKFRFVPLDDILCIVEETNGWICGICFVSIQFLSDTVSLWEYSSNRALIC